MDPGNIPFNALIVGPTNSGKTQFLVNHQIKRHSMKLTKLR